MNASKKLSIYTFFILCLNIGQAFGTVMNPSAQVLYDQCYPGSPALWTLTCNGVVYGPGPGQQGASPSIGQGVGHPWMRQYKPPTTPINMGDGIGNGTWGQVEAGPIQCMAIGCGDDNNFSYPRPHGQTITPVWAINDQRPMFPGINNAVGSTRILPFYSIQ